MSEWLEFCKILGAFLSGVLSGGVLLILKSWFDKRARKIQLRAAVRELLVGEIRLDEWVEQARLAERSVAANLAAVVRIVHADPLSALLQELGVIEPHLMTSSLRLQGAIQAYRSAADAAQTDVDYMVTCQLRDEPIGTSLRLGISIRLMQATELAIRVSAVAVELLRRMELRFDAAALEKRVEEATALRLEWERELFVRTLGSTETKDQATVLRELAELATRSYEGHHLEAARQLNLVVSSLTSVPGGKSDDR